MNDYGRKIIREVPDEEELEFTISREVLKEAPNKSVSSPPEVPVETSSPDTGESQEKEDILDKVNAIKIELTAKHLADAKVLESEVLAILDTMKFKNEIVNQRIGKIKKLLKEHTQFKQNLVNSTRE